MGRGEPASHTRRMHAPSGMAAHAAAELGLVSPKALADGFAASVLQSIPAFCADLRTSLVDLYNGISEAAGVLQLLQADGAQGMFRAMEDLYLRGTQDDYTAFVRNLRSLFRDEIRDLRSGPGESEEDVQRRRSVMTTAVEQFFNSASSHKISASGWCQWDGGHARSCSAGAAPHAAGKLEELRPPHILHTPHRQVMAQGQRHGDTRRRSLGSQALRLMNDRPAALCTTPPADLAAVVPSVGTGATAAGCDVALASGSSGAPPGAGVSGGGGDRPVGGGVLLGVLG